MLIKISILNFRSIRERVVLNLTPTRLKGLSANTIQTPDAKELLKSIVLYGPNASGKSVSLLAMKALQYLVVQSADYKPNDKIGPYEPHKLEKDFSIAPVSFDTSFFANSIKYDFSISFTSKRVELEKLFYYPKGVKTLLYKRQAEKPIKFGESYRGGKKVIEKLLLENQLFISKAAENNAESVLSPYLFFKNGIMVFPFIESGTDVGLSQLYAKRLAISENSKFSRNFNNLICALDTGIISVNAREVDWEKYEFLDSIPDDLRKEIRERYKYDIKTSHLMFNGKEKIGEINFDVEEESMGTKRLFVIGGIILDALEQGKVLVIDEFEKDLHPNITQYLIRLFHNPITNPKGAQLIFATHDITQLSNDTFRRDQVWFTEKDEFGATRLYRCSDIKGIRLGTPLDKWYSTGRLGATPIINDVELLMEMQEDATA